MIINSRPLNMLHDEKMYEIITPNRLLFGQKLYQENRNWESNSDIVELETKRIQYITSLQECQKSFKTKKQLFRAKDDIVLSYEEKQPRKKWLLGKTVDFTPIQDGQARGARVLLGRSRNTVDRPVNRLYPLETNFKSLLKDPEQNNVHEVIKEGTCRPKREAEKLAKFRMRYAPDINWRGDSVKYSDTYLT